MIKKVFITALLLSAIFSGMLFANNKVDTCINNSLKIYDIKDILVLRACDLNATDVPALVEFLQANPLCHRLDLASNNIGDEGARIMLTVSTIRNLFLDHNNITDVGVKYFMESKVVDLGLSGNDITDKGAIAISQNDNLNFLWIDNNHIGDEGAIALGKAHLTLLDVSHNNISADGAIRLARNKKLIYLFISGNNIGDKGISELALLPNLVWLIANNTAFGDAGISAIANSQTIIYLVIAHNLITDQGAFALAKTTSTEFHSISIGSNHLITDKGRAALNKRFGVLVDYNDDPLDFGAGRRLNVIMQQVGLLPPLFATANQRIKK